jgi:Domain of unknown function (DUF1707)
MLDQDVERSESLGAQMTAGYGYPAAGGGPLSLRASDADRDRAAAILGAAYTEGRLSEDEYDDRLQGALSARTYAPSPSRAVLRLG